jgi:hypothetical protein
MLTASDVILQASSYVTHRMGRQPPFSVESHFGSIVATKELPKIELKEKLFRFPNILFEGGPKLPI